MRQQKMRSLKTSCFISTWFLTFLSAAPDSKKNSSSTLATWMETVAGFNPIVLVAYDILVANETRMALWDHGRVRSLELIPLVIYEEEEGRIYKTSLSETGERENSLLERVISLNIKTISRILKNPGFGLYVERWLNLLQENEVDNLKSIREILARKEITRTFTELDGIVRRSSDLSVIPSDFLEIIVQSLDYLLMVMTNKGGVKHNEVIAANYVGPCARVLLLTITQDTNNDYGLQNYFVQMAGNECNILNVQKNANRFMAVVNSALLLEAILINKGMLSSQTSARIVSKDLRVLYAEAERKIDSILVNCTTQ